MKIIGNLVLAFVFLLMMLIFFYSFFDQNLIKKLSEGDPVNYLWWGLIYFIACGEIIVVILTYIKKANS